MKKILLFIFTFLLFTKVNALELTKNAGSAILIESTTGKILYSKDEHEKRSPASMTKMMTLLLVMEQIDSGKIKLTDKVTISENSSNMGGSQVYLQPNEVMTVDELIKSVCISSANDVVVTKKQLHVIGEGITI